jgi:hypothetical protein
MERFGGVRNPRSGGRWDRRNDGRTATELVEFKRTDNQRSITLLRDDLESLYRHAMAEARRPVLGFQLGERDFVVIPERDYLDPAPGRLGRPASHPRTEPTGVLRSGQVLGELHRESNQPVLRRSPAQRAGLRGQVGVPRHPSELPRTVPGDRRVPRIRPGQQREVGSLGRLLRKGTPPDQARPTAGSA